MRKSVLLFVAVALAGAFMTACASLGSLNALIRPPHFDQAEGRNVEVRLLAPSLTNPLGGASVRLWTKVSNPNPFGFTVASLAGTLFLDDARAATTEFPLGLPLAAGGEAVIPIDLAISFAELPQLATVIRRAAAREPVEYHFDGTIGVDAGRLGTPVFGPLTFLRGTID